MTRRQLDLYAECNGGQAPEEIFREACCSRCVNPDCSRSMYGKTKFEDRVQNWHERMFSNVPRMAADDERYSQIAGQRFLLIDPVSLGGGSSAWVDPRDLEPKPMVHVQRPIPSPPPPVVSAPEPIKTPEPPEPPKAQEPPSAAPATVPSAPVSQASVAAGALNTPIKGGQMLTKKGPEPASGGWVTPPPPAIHEPGAPVVKTGARIKIGS